MRLSPVLILVLVTLASWTLLCHAAPAELLPRQAHELIESISPEEGHLYEVGEIVLAKVRVIDNELKGDTKIKLTFQRAIPKPDINIFLADVNLSQLSHDGYQFKLSKDHQGNDTDRTNHYRIRYSFNDKKFHYVDSAVFSIAPSSP